MGQRKICKYRLFVMPVNAYNIERASKSRFHRVTPGYILTYRRGKCASQELEIAGDDLQRLSGRDSSWLMDCNLALLAEESGKAAPQARARLEAMIDELAEALRQEREKARGEAGTVESR